ncbi:uncharacterized protein LOC129584181 [Paramacrobiotus metropolitanus]|uniref:uncharacterized protein LOC129584181 n=1 Tax=Paramacrobiotus metropolitanus TaxID=2943436 RepID=UPI002445F046|nr:uncharacterized protein LOC129584181 [Paramacrobiotus metropolitanus]
MLTYTANLRLLSDDPDYFQIFPTVIFGFILVAFPYPFLKVDSLDSIIETEICNLTLEALPLTTPLPGNKVKALFEMLLLAQQKLKLQATVAGFFNLTWPLMIKTVALIASITVLANEFISKGSVDIHQKTKTNTTS